MPHVIVKLWPGKSERQKSGLPMQNRRNEHSALRRTVGFGRNGRNHLSGLG